MDAKAAPGSRRQQSAGSVYDSSAITQQRRRSRPTAPACAALPTDRPPAVALQQARPANPTAPPVQAVNQPLEPPKPAEQPAGASPANGPAPRFTSGSAGCWGGACNAHVVLCVLVFLFIVSLVTFIIFYRLMLKHSQLESTPAAEHRDWQESGEFTAIAVERTPAPQKPAPPGGIRSTESARTQERGGRVPTDANDEVSPMRTETSVDEISEDNNATVPSLGRID